jgi:hypothetical protein
MAGRLQSSAMRSLAVRSFFWRKRSTQMAENHSNPRDHPVKAVLYQHQLEAYYFVLQLFEALDGGDRDEENADCPM